MPAERISFPEIPIEPGVLFTGKDANGHRVMAVVMHVRWWFSIIWYLCDLLPRPLSAKLLGLGIDYGLSIEIVERYDGKDPVGIDATA